MSFPPLNRLFLLLTLLGIGSLAADPVWRIEKGDNHFYIGGTVHLLAQSDYPLPDAFDRAYADSQHLVFETDISALSKPGERENLLAALSYRDGRSLRSVLSPETFAALKAHCSERGFSVENLLSYKPGMVAMSLTMLEMQRLGLAGTGVDEFFDQRARADAKDVGQLELLSEQMRFIAAMGEGKEDELIEYTLRDISELPETMGQMKRAWREGDLSKLEKVALVPFKQESPRLYRALIVERNRHWMPKIEAMARQPERLFVLVGALHLVGEDGLLEHLEARGYRIVPL